MSGLGAAIALNVGTGNDCEPEGSVCPENQCCGVATMPGKDSLKICYHKDATYWTNPDDGGNNWGFACYSPPPNFTGANTLAATSLILAGLAAYL